MPVYYISYNKYYKAFKVLLKSDFEDIGHLFIHKIWKLVCVISSEKRAEIICNRLNEIAINIKYKAE